MSKRAVERERGASGWRGGLLELGPLNAVQLGQRTKQGGDLLELCWFHYNFGVLMLSQYMHCSRSSLVSRPLLARSSSPPKHSNSHQHRLTTSNACDVNQLQHLTRLSFLIFPARTRRDCSSASLDCPQLSPTLGDAPPRISLTYSTLATCSHSSQ